MKKNNIYVVLVVTVLVSLICGSIGAYLVLYNNANIYKTSSTNDKVNSSITLTETDSISDSVSKFNIFTNENPGTQIAKI